MPNDFRASRRSGGNCQVQRKDPHSDSRPVAPHSSRFVSRDLKSGEDITAPTQAGFIPMLALDLDDAVMEALTAEMASWSHGLKVAFPTTRPNAPGWEPKRYWRGPAWAIINWLLIDGLDRNGRIPWQAGCAPVRSRQLKEKASPNISIPSLEKGVEVSPFPGPLPHIFIYRLPCVVEAISRTHSDTSDCAADPCPLFSPAFEKPRFRQLRQRLTDRRARRRKRLMDCEGRLRAASNVLQLSVERSSGYADHHEMTTT